jgi:hypothetical protein
MGKKLSSTIIFYIIARRSYGTTGYYGLGVFATVVYEFSVFATVCCGKNQSLLMLNSSDRASTADLVRHEWLKT